MMDPLAAVTDRSRADLTEEVLSFRGRRLLLVAFVIFVAFGQLFSATDEYYLYVFSRVLIFALFALSLDFAFGYSGLPSFGHAAMFGVAGYVAAFLLTTTTQSVLLVLPVIFVTGFLLAGVIGFFAIHARGIYFAMLTLAFAQLLYITVLNDLPATLFGVDKVTNGGNGLIGIPRYTFLGAQLASQLKYYYFVLIAVAVSLVVLIRIANSPFGRVMAGINQNEERIASLGYNVRWYKNAAFALSGGFAGLAGALFVPLQSLAHPSMLHWLMSGQVIIHVLLGGMGTLWGPMVGAGIDIMLQELLAGSEYWQIFIGLLYILVVIFIPEGIAGAVYTITANPTRIPHKIRVALQAYYQRIVQGR